MLMLGIGATTTVFSVFYSVLLKPLPFRDLDRIVEVWETRLDRGWNRASFTAANFWDVRMLNRSFSEIAAINWSSANLTGLDQPEHVSRGEVTAGFSEHLESRQWSAATFVRRGSPRAGQPGSDPFHRLWKRRFGGNPRIAGTTVSLNDRAFAAGVLPPGTPWLNSADISCRWFTAPTPIEKLRARRD
jgi:hypothetical protein